MDAKTNLRIQFMATAQNPDRSITLHVPQEIYDKVRESAQRTNRSPEEEAQRILQHAVERREHARESLKRARAAYDEYLECTGTPRPTTEELWEQLRRVREEVADELDPK